MQQEQIISFLGKFAAGNYAEEEHQQFIDWLKTASIENVEIIAEEYKKLAATHSTNVANAELVCQIEAALDQYELGNERKTVPGKVISLQRFWKVAVAASVILILGGGIYFLFFNKAGKNTEYVRIPKLPHDVKAPESNRAMITLTNGQRIYLDSAGNGTLANEGSVRLVKLRDGQIAYIAPAQGQGDKELVYNTLTNPRGSKIIDMKFGDGSRVWLNAGSSVTYPVAFIGNERKVEITGEAYFEVVRNKSMPFKVEVRQMEVEVLGTHFNINAYDDEPLIKTTLLEGAVKVKKDNNFKFLSPGQQAQINNTKEIKLVRDVDIEETMAWKNGKFIFNANDIRSVMRQLQKWYDIEVEFNGDVSNEEFVGIISRNVDISQILNMLEKTRTVYFEIKGRKVIVK